MNQPTPTTALPVHTKPKPKPVAVARISDFMQLTDALRLALMALEVAVNAFEQDLNEGARLQVVCGLRKQIAGLKRVL